MTLLLQSPRGVTLTTDYCSVSDNHGGPAAREDPDEGRGGAERGIQVNGCQMAKAGFLESYVFGLLGFWTMAPLRYAAKLDPFLS